MYIRFLYYNLEDFLGEALSQRFLNTWCWWILLGLDVLDEY